MNKSTTRMENRFFKLTLNWNFMKSCIYAFCVCMLNEPCGIVWKFGYLFISIFRQLIALHRPRKCFQFISNRSFFLFFFQIQIDCLFFKWIWNSLYHFSVDELSLWRPCAYFVLDSIIIICIDWFHENMMVFLLVNLERN